MTEQCTPSTAHPVPQENGWAPSTKACMSCRSLKVRCIVNSSPDDKRCQRCIKSDRECVFPAPQKRKQRKRTDARVGELEKEIRTMKMLLSRREDRNIPREGQSGPASAPSEEPSTWGSTKGNTVSQTVGVSPSSSGVGPSPSVHGDIGKSPESDARTAFMEKVFTNPDVINLGLLPIETATDLFEVYNHDLVEHFPLVVFPEGYSLDKLRANRPTLFLAVMAAAAMKSHPQLSINLNKHLLQSCATRIMMNSEKSLELVQAMIVTAIWYSPPGGSSQLKFYEYIHMAASMALDIGLGSKPSQMDGHQGNPAAQSPTWPDATNTLMGSALSAPTISHSSEVESRRTLLSCYVMCCGVSLSMRRPNSLRYNNWMGECVKYLQTSPAVLPSDRNLVAWVQLLKISEEIAVAFSFEDMNNIASLSDHQTQLMLKLYEERLNQWRRHMDSRIMIGSLAIMYHNMSIYLHEIALHGKHSPESFKPPYQFENIHSNKGKNSSLMTHLDSVIQCITSAHTLIETFLCMDIELLRTLPIFNYIRLTYAVFILETLATSANDASDEVGFLSRRSLQVDHYISLVINHLELVVGPAKCKTPSMFLGLMLRVQVQRWTPEQPPIAKASFSTRPEEIVSFPGASNQATPVRSSNESNHRLSTPQSEALHDTTYHPSQRAGDLASHQPHAETAHDYDAMLDFSGDYYMDLDPDRLSFLNGIENMSPDPTNWEWPVNYDTPTDTLRQ